MNSLLNFNAITGSFNNFLDAFVDEMRMLQHTYERDKPIYVGIHSVVCDGPAKADVKYMKHPTGFFACDKCEQKGKKINRRMTFLETNEILRDDQSFRRRDNEEHHKGDSIIEAIQDLDMVDDFPLDPLHVIYLGVMKRLLRIWISGDEGSVLEEISELLKSIGQAQPKEFQRKCRELSYIGYFKGHEFRTFLLYSGPVVLKHKISIEKYNHFLLLHTAITILNREDMCQSLNRLAECLLRDFIKGNQIHFYGR